MNYNYSTFKSTRSFTNNPNIVEHSRSLFSLPNEDEAAAVLTVSPNRGHLGSNIGLSGLSEGARSMFTRSHTI